MSALISSDQNSRAVARAIHRARFAATFTALACATATVPACNSPARPSGDAADVSLSISGVLRRCETTYTGLNSLEARGWLRDYRSTDRRVVPIRWELARPDQCRLQIDMDMVLVKGQNWWSYNNQSQQFKSHRELGGSPIEAAAYFLSDGIPFLLPAAWHRPKVAFGSDEARGPWQLDGVAWTANRPCYVVSRQGLGRDSGSRWTLWIDQDRFLIVAWTWDVMRPSDDGTPLMKTVWGCTYEVMVANAELNQDRFRIEKPLPIALPRAAPSELKSPPGG
ncbi:MAG: hypothetical protein KF841_16795 [Phycisphaerae bacterium]|nr:hypothetical protein [Phycisphaerae bacterium]